MRMSARSWREAARYDIGGRRLKFGDRIVSGANVVCGACHFCSNNYPYYMCENGLRQQPALRPAAASLRRLGGVHVSAAWYAYLSGAGRLARPCCRADRDHVGDTWRRNGAEPARVNRGSRFGQSIAVLGVGPLGLCHLIKAKLLGGGKLIATDCLPSCRRRSLHPRRLHGADHRPARTGGTSGLKTKTHRL
jgi:threonine dehydrogenase-like Zn-dependent dehydrogenase